MAETAVAAFPTIPFADHLSELQWRQGQHVVMAGPTGSGKTTLAKSLLEKRSHVIGFGTKAKDPTLQNEYKGWSFVQDIDEVEPWMNRVMLWPKPKRRDTADEWRAKQRLAYKRAFDVLLKSNGWAVFVDELAYMSTPKFGNVGSQIEMMTYIGRSAGLSVVSLAQRPSHVPLSVLSNSSHAYVAQTYLHEDAKRLSNLGGIDSKLMAKAMVALPTRFDFLYMPTLGQGRAGVVNSHL